MLTELLHYAGWVWRCKVRGRREPLTSSIILTDRCNLTCAHCTVAHLDYPAQRFAEVERDVRHLYEMGSRMLVITGGEPFMWRDGERGLDDVVLAARRMGFFRTVVCTNGTFPLASEADYLWVSLDGGPAEHNRMRGAVHDRVWKNIDQSEHPNIFVNFTISRVTLGGARTAAAEILRSPKIRGILFLLFTPYVGSDPELVLDADQRLDAVRLVAELKRAWPRRVSNTTAGIRALERDDWPRRLWSSVVINRGKVTPCCCRAGIADADVCRRCGCTPAVETYVLQRLSPGAIVENLRYLS